MESSREKRARWPIERLGLQEDSSDDLSSITTPAERIAMMWFLAETPWKVSGLTFDEVLASRVAVELDGRTIAFIGRDALLRNKEASGRLKDLADAERLRKTRPRGAP